jgi:hypothetical protein
VRRRMPIFISRWDGILPTHKNINLRRLANKRLTVYMGRHESSEKQILEAVAA